VYLLLVITTQKTQRSRATGSLGSRARWNGKREREHLSSMNVSLVLAHMWVAFIGYALCFMRL